jgi:bacillithiol biosynthesis cysteine-adding enzyme BshC
MEPSCIRQSLIPGTSKLFGDYLYDFHRVARYYSHAFSEPDSFTEAAKCMQFPDSRREAIVAALRRQNGDSAALRKLAQPGTVAVVTGQQVGFLSGPAYTVFKALTAVRLAQHLTTQGIPAVPIFWLATEDHDLAEVDHAWVFDHQARPEKIAVTGTVVNGGPVGDVQFTEIPLDKLRAALGDLPFADEVVERLGQAYQPGASFGASFRHFVQDVLKGCGLLYLDPLGPAVRQIAVPFLTEVVERLPELLSDLKQRNDDLVAAGYHAQVHVDEQTSLLFLINQGKRVPMRWDNGRFRTKDGSYVTADLEGLAPRISPNALLRPVMQDYLLPTIAYVGGPSEIAYMAQSQVLYHALLHRMPVIFPRNSFTLLDARAAKLMQRYELGFADLLDHQAQVKSRIAARLVPHGLSEEFAALRTNVTASVEKARENLAGFDPTLEAASKKSLAKILYQVEKLGQRTAREIMRRDERATKDADYLINLVYPQRHLQERLYSIVPFLAKYGMDLPERLLGLAQLACPDHMVRTL